MGTHFDRTQTWWKPGKALVDYWQRCQALLQWGKIVLPAATDFVVIDTAVKSLRYIHRKEGGTDIYFVANTARKAATTTCQFAITGMQPELWDPVTTTMRPLTQYEDDGTHISLPVSFEESQSFFVVFRKKPTGTKAAATASYFTPLKEAKALTGPWQVKFDTAWGGPKKPVRFASLQDWTTNDDAGIKYFSGTAVYTKTFDVTAAQLTSKAPLYVDLGTVKHIAVVKINGKNAGTVWTAPWHIQIPPGLLKAKANKLEIEVTNVWVNRLIGDKQEPADCEWLTGHMNSGSFLKAFPDWFLNHQPRPSKGRYCFTTWNYFTKNSPLIPSGLLGPVRLMQ